MEHQTTNLGVRSANLFGRAKINQFRSNAELAYFYSGRTARRTFSAYGPKGGFRSGPGYSFQSWSMTPWPNICSSLPSGLDGQPEEGRALMKEAKGLK